MMVFKYVSFCFAITGLLTSGFAQQAKPFCAGCCPAFSVTAVKPLAETGEGRRESLRDRRCPQQVLRPPGHFPRDLFEWGWTAGEAKA